MTSATLGDAYLQNLAPALNSFSKISSTASAIMATSAADTILDSVRRIQETQTRTIKMAGAANANALSSFAAQRTLASAVANNAAMSKQMTSSSERLAKMLDSSAVLRNIEAAHSGAFHSALQSSFASQNALSSAALAKSMANVLKPLESRALLENLSRSVLVRHPGLIMPDSFLRTLDMSAAVMPRRIDDPAGYAQSQRVEEVAERLDAGDIQLEVFDVELDPETRLYLANSVPIDVGMFMAATTFAEVYLPDRPLTTPIAGGIGLLTMYMVRRGMDFIRGGGRGGRKDR